MDHQVYLYQDIDKPTTPQMYLYQDIDKSTTPQMYLYRDLLRIVFEYLQPLDQYRARASIVSGELSAPVIEQIPWRSTDFYNLFADLEYSEDDTFYELFQIDEDTPRFNYRFIINKKFAHLHYPDMLVKKLYIKSDIMEALIIDAARIEKIIIRAPKLVNLAIYGFGTRKNYYESKKENLPMISMPGSVERFALEMYENCDHRLLPSMIIVDKSTDRSESTTRLLNVSEFYTSFPFFEDESDDITKIDLEFISYINPDVVLDQSRPTAPQMHLCRDILWLTGSQVDSDSVVEYLKSNYKNSQLKLILT